MKKTLLWVAYALIMIGWAIKSRPWEAEPEVLLTGAGLGFGMLVLGNLLGRINDFGKSRGIGEARFDSKTGKVIQDE